ncbi:MAG: sulfite exporter TauE/SafE family protein [Limosilactobacillus pontis]
MISNLILLITVGLLVGIFVISLGGGGGAIYLGVLTALFSLPPATAAATSIVTALPALVLGSWAYYRRGMIDFHLGNRMLVAAIPSIFVGFWLSPWLPEQTYKLVIGLILVALGIQLIYKVYHQPVRKQVASKWGRSLRDSRWPDGRYRGLSGGGPITAGLLLLNVRMANASATSAYVLVGMSVVGAILHLTGGSVDRAAAGGLVAGSLVGALLAPPVILWLTRKSQRTLIIKLVLGIMLILMGIKTTI